MELFTLNPDVVVPMLALLVPGFVWLEIELRIAPRPHLNHARRYFLYVVYSLINLALFYPIVLVYLVPALNRSELTATTSLGLLLVLIVGPLVWGIVIALARRSSWLRKTLAAARISCGSDGSSAWDFAFNRSTGCLACVFLKSSKVVYGIFNTRDSIASAIPAERDVYFERRMFEDQEGRLCVDKESCGMWIPASEIARIEFYDFGEMTSATESIEQQQEAERERVTIAEARLLDRRRTEAQERTPTVQSGTSAN